MVVEPHTGPPLARLKHKGSISGSCSGTTLFGRVLAASLARGSGATRGTAFVATRQMSLAAAALTGRGHLVDEGRGRASGRLGNHARLAPDRMVAARESKWSTRVYAALDLIPHGEDNWEETGVTGHPKIILVEDDAFQRQVIAEGLAQHGLRPTALASGAEMKRLSQQAMPDLALLDVHRTS